MHVAPYMAWLSAISLTVLALVLTYQGRAYLKLRHIPGPTLAAWTSLWLVFSQLTGRMHLILRDVVEKHGPIARIAPNWIVCGDASELRRIWGVRSTWTRGWWYRGMRINPYRDSSFSTIDNKQNTAIRNKLLPGYGGKDVDNLHGIIDEQVAELVHLLDRNYISNADGGHGVVVVVDLAQKVQFFALDVISTLAFGKTLGFLAKDKDQYHYIETTGKTVHLLVSSALIPGVISVLQSPHLRWVMPRIENMAGIGHVIRFAREAVAQRHGHHGGDDDDARSKRDMLGSFVAHGLSREDCESEALVQLIAGSETTATAIQATLLFLMTSPQVCARLQAELDAAIDERRVSSPITDAEARALPYLQAVILEGLRMFPPAAALYPKVSAQDEVVCGVRVPAGTNVAWSPWSMMRDAATFGPDADVFRPERWLHNTNPVMEQTVMMAFAAGSRWECLGRNIAMIELNKVFVELLRRFDFTLVNPLKPWNSFNAGMFSQTDFHVTVTRRRQATR